MPRRRRRWSIWGAVVGVSVWAASFYQAYTGLSIPAFGPAEQGALAVRNLTIRYGIYLIVGAGAWYAARRAMRRRAKSVRHIKVRGFG